MKIVPAILSVNYSEFEDKLRTLEGAVFYYGSEEALRTDTVHVDIIDESFSETESLSIQSLRGVATEFLVDIHLMVDEPISYVRPSIDAMADRIIGQIERMSSQQEFVASVKEEGVGVGLAVDLSTPITSLDKEALMQTDVVLLMAVEAGKGGQEFSEEILNKVREVKDLRQEIGAEFLISLDGGIHLDNINRVTEVGVDEVAVGSGIYEGDIAKNLKDFYENIHQ